MKLKERVRDNREERSGRSELVEAAIQEVVDGDDEDVRRIIADKLDHDRPLLNPPATAEEDLAAELCDCLRSNE